MKYEEIFARSFSRHDQRRFGYGASVACFIVICCLCTVFKPYIGPFPVSNLRLTLVDGLKLVMISERSRKPVEYVEIVKETMVICKTSKQRSDTCEIKGDVRIEVGNSSTIFVFSCPHHSGNGSWAIKPYARKGDISAMEGVTNFTIKVIQEEVESSNILKCTKTHNVPAVVFSVGGYARNNFHAFTDVIIPLYATSREFNREVKFLVADDHNKQWTRKFQQVLQKLSRYKIIDFHDQLQAGNEVHCFPSMIVGLRKDNQGKELHYTNNVNNSSSVKDFTRFLRSSYSLERPTAIKLATTNAAAGSSSVLLTRTKKPRLLIVSRQKTRTLTNVNDVVRAARDIGFQVIVAEMNANLTQVSRLVNSCDVMMGVHGAGLTNMLFLPENGVLIQVVPMGNMDWLANTYFGLPSRAMGLNYLEYKIDQMESTLIHQYPLNHQVFRDPISIQIKGWAPYRSIYLDKQNVMLNVTRFKQTLSKALELLHL